jgi:hypothetical protein
VSEESNRNQDAAETRPELAGWTEPRSPTVPAPTYWPAVAALSVVMMLLGILTSWAISAAGLLLFALSMKHWWRN